MFRNGGKKMKGQYSSLTVRADYVVILSRKERLKHWFWWNKERLKEKIGYRIQKSKCFLKLHKLEEQEFIDHGNFVFERIDYCYFCDQEKRTPISKKEYFDNFDFGELEDKEPSW